MKTSKLHSSIVVPVAILLAVQLPLRAAETVMRKEFDSTPGAKLLVAADRGNVTIKTGTGNKVAIEVRRKIEKVSDSKAQEVFQDHEVTIGQADKEISVRAEFRTKRTFWSGPETQLQVNYEISVPKNFNLDLKTAGGSITVGDLQGEIKMQTAAGNLKTGKIDGPVTAHTSGGSISLGSATTVSAKTSAGSIVVGETRGDLSAQTHGGSITIEKAGGKIEAETSAGNIRIGEGASDVAARTSGGSIDIRKTKGTLSAKTSAGNIVLGELDGTVDARTSGGSITAGIQGQPKEDCHLETSAGNITVTAMKSLAVNLDASASAGDVTCELPVTIQGKRSDRSLQGKINGGGPALILRTHGGSIRLQQK